MTPARAQLLLSGLQVLYVAAAVAGVVWAARAVLRGDQGASSSADAWMEE